MNDTITSCNVKMLKRIAENDKHTTSGIRAYLKIFKGRIDVLDMCEFFGISKNIKNEGRRNMERIWDNTMRRKGVKVFPRSIQYEEGDDGNGV